MKRGLLVVLGILLLVSGLVLAAAGVVVAVSVGSDDALTTDPARVNSTGVAVVAENLSVDATSIPVPSGVGTLTLSARSLDGRAVFLGSARPSDVDTYLTGAPYEVVVDLSTGRPATTRKVPGKQQPPPPGSEAFWSVSSTASTASVTARLAPGSTLVVMNADASTGVTADLVVTLRIPHVWAYSWVVVGVGVLLVILAVVAFWRARVAGRRARQGAAAAAGEAGDSLLPTSGATVLPGVAAAPEPATVEAATAQPPVHGPVVVDPVATPSAIDLGAFSDDVVPAPASAALAALVIEASGEAADAGPADALPVDDAGPVDAGPVDAPGPAGATVSDG